MKKHILLLTAASLSLLLASCSFTSSASSLPRVGILQFVTHDGLNLCRTGFIAGMKQGGYEEDNNVSFTIMNPEGDASTQNSMAVNLRDNCQLVCGIATPSALALKTSIEDVNKDDLPLVFCAVTDPVKAGLVKSFTEHANIVGTSDAGPTYKNIELFKKFEGIEKIGILYNLTEPNSIVQFEETKSACQELNLTLVDGGFSSTSELESTLEGMIGQGIKGLFIPVDNTVAAAMASIKEKILQHSVLAVCGDASEIKNGGSLGYATDYYSLGIQTGKLAARILKGEKTETIPCEKSEVYNLYINDSYFKETAYTLPSDLAPLGNGVIIHE
ncbi:MAG: ABC transporter substrate-binding protein [Bacilli bacterium]|nr:ABC transporter substrate-binding protein [Bacilli bacterium]